MKPDVCPRCAQPRRAGAQYCWHCGQPFQLPAALPVGRAPRRCCGGRSGLRLLLAGLALLVVGVAILSSRRAHQRRLWLQERPRMSPHLDAGSALQIESSDDADHVFDETERVIRDSQRKVEQIFKELERSTELPPARHVPTH